MSKALFVVDVQFCMFFGDWPLPDAEPLLSRISNAVLQAREAGTPVYFVQNDGPEGELDAPGMPYWELVLAPRSTEPVIRKTTQDVFESNPDLAGKLKAKGISTIEFVGVQSELCLRASSLGAKQRGFDIVVRRELHGSYDQLAKSAKEVADEVQAELEAAG